jgi:DNA integrity scanning protein DisA with diadenylate cyclase activity
MEISPTKTPEELFLNACIELKEETHDNSARLPEGLPADHGTVENHEQLWKNYLKCKFIYLLNALGNADAEALVLKEANELRLPDPKQFINHWSRIRSAEERAFFYRIIQLPREIVLDWWYDQKTQSIRLWCDSLSGKYDTLKKAVESRERGVKDLKDQADHIKREFNFIPTDHIFDTLIKQQTDDLSESFLEKKRDFAQALSHLSSQVTVSEVSNIEHPFLELRDFLLKDLTKGLTKSLLNYGHDETMVIRTFLYALKKLFKCDVVDYLDVEGKSQSDERLVLRVATLGYEELSDQFKIDVNKDKMAPAMWDRETYRRGEGISGSILLLDRALAQDWWIHHIGSNDLVQDPRQSKSHLSVYESDVYVHVLTGGKIKNFWVFPIFVESKLKGAFRVVNKVADDGCTMADWTFLDRVQLAIVAAWFSNFLETLQPYIHSSEAWFVIVRREQAVKSLVRHLELAESKNQIVQAIITHLLNDLGKRIEKRVVGCCIILAKNADKVLGQFKEFPLIDSDSTGIAYPYEGTIDKYHDAINPSLGGYLLDEDGTFRAFVRFSRKNKNEALSPEVITKDINGTICFLLKRGAKKIHVYKGGTRTADIFTSEYTGEWILRFPDEIKNKIRALAPKNNRAIDLVADVCLDLSNSNYGGIFVFGPRDELVSALEHHLEPRPSSIKYRKAQVSVAEVGEEILIELSKIDGATLIDHDGFVIETNFVIRLRKDSEPSGQVVGIVDVDNGKSNELRKRGARHNAGMDVSRVCPESLVIIVSENGGISLIRNGVPADLEL